MRNQTFKKVLFWVKNEKNVFESFSNFIKETPGFVSMEKRQW